MDARKLLVAMVLLVIMQQAFATITVTVNTPTANQTFEPNMDDADDCMDINFSITDNNANQPIRKANIYYDHPDGNTYISADLNLSGAAGGNCKLGEAGAWTAATCKVRYCFPSTLTSGRYMLDVNVTGYHTGGTTQWANDEGLQNFTIDNRYITASVETLVNVTPIVLVGAIIVTITLTLLGVVSPAVVVVLLPSLIIALIAILVFGQIMLPLTGK
jgi:methionine-rich copper-binding protein CopC